MTMVVVDWGYDPDARPEFPGSETSDPETPDEIALPDRPHPWASFDPGAWVRVKETVFEGRTPRVSMIDKLLTDIYETVAELSIRTLTPEGTIEETTASETIPADDEVVGEEFVTIGETTIPCLIISTVRDGEPVKIWVPREGEDASLAVLKIQMGSFILSAISMGHENVTVGEMEIDCLKVTLKGEMDGRSMIVDSWISPMVPGFEVRSRKVNSQPGIAEATKKELTAFGLDKDSMPGPLSMKPMKPKDPVVVPPPVVVAPPPEEVVPSGIKTLAEADGVLMEGIKLYKVVRSGAKLQRMSPNVKTAMIRKAAQAREKITAARDAYEALKHTSPDPTKLTVKIGKLDSLLGRLNKLEDGINSK